MEKKTITIKNFVHGFGFKLVPYEETTHSNALYKETNINKFTARMANEHFLRFSKNDLESGPQSSEFKGTRRTLCVIELQTGRPCGKIVIRDSMHISARSEVY